MASKAIKGITIKLDGDTGGLTKSISEADKELKSIESQLKAVDKALKLDPTNMELIAKKQELLSKEIETTKQKLDAEKQAAEQAAQALEDGTITQAEYDALQTEIQNTANSLKELEDAGKESGSAIGSAMQAAGEKIQEVGDKVKKVGDGLTKNVTAPIVAVGAAAVTSFTEYDSALDTVIKKTGVTGDALGEYEDILKSIATTIPVDMATAGAAIGDVATKFGVTGSELENLSTKFIEFSLVNNTDVSSSVMNVQKALQAFGLPASDAEAMLDRLTKVSQETGADINKLTDGLVSNSAAFMELGLDADQAAEFMGKLEMSGVNAETVMQAFRKALKNATADGTDLQTALERLQNEILYGADGMDGLTYSYETFGKSGDQIYAALKMGTLDFKHMGDTAKSAGGTVQKTFEATLSPTDKMKTATNKAKIAMADLGGQVSGALVPIIDKLTDLLEDLSDWWDTLDEDEQTQIINAALVAAAIGPVISIIGSLITNVGVIVSALGTLTTFITATAVPTLTTLGTTIMTTVIPAVVAAAPVILAVVAAIAAVVAIIEAVKSVIENSDAWMSFFEEQWEGLKDTFQGVWDKLVEVKNGIVNTCQELVDDVKDKFTGLVTSALTWGKDLIQNFIDGMESLWEKFTSTTKKFAGKVADFLGFSEPDEGPLSNFHTFAPDMIDLWNETLLDNLDKVEDSSEIMADTVATPLEGVDYSSQLSGISGQLAGLGSGATLPPINLTTVIGGRRFEREVSLANVSNDYISGGR